MPADHSGDTIPNSMRADFDSNGVNGLSSAVGWLQSALLGAAATTVAILAVASIGFLMLTGRSEVRRAARVILGCFILFSAATIANGIIGILQPAPPPPTAAVPAPAYTPSVPKASSADPFPGASIPDQRTKDISN
jgi:type IV secretory pathway VirB2 component (pilin)